MSFGWTGRLLEINLTSGETTERDILAYVDSYLGGRTLAARLAWETIPPGTDALDPENRIIMMTGPLTGTPAPTSGRAVMGSVSPRTYPFPWYTHSTLGGWFGPQLKYAGYDGLIIHGAAPTPTIIEITDRTVRLVEAGDLWGADTRVCQLRLKERYGQEAQVLCIGPAAENLIRFATVQHAEENAAGHSGFGSVWGSKRLKAIVVRGSGAVSVADPEALLRETLALGSFQPTPLSANTLPGESYRRRREPICSQSCRFNCQVAQYRRTADGRRMPAICIGPVWRMEGGLQYTAYEGGGLRVPPTPNFDMATETHLHELCNLLGTDMWFRQVMQPWLIRCCELGVMAIRGHALAPDDPQWFEGFMRDLAARRGLGELLGEDLVRAMDILEGELPEELITLGRELEFDFGFPAHREGRFWDEEPLPFWVISAMMHASESRDPTIGSHQSSMHLPYLWLADPEVARRQYRRLAEQVWGDPEALEPTYENKAPVAIWSQDQHLLIDSLTLCDFAFPQLVKPLDGREVWQETDDILGDLDIDLRLLAAVTGRQLDRHALTQVARRGLTLERALLARAGRSRALEEGLASHFALPCRDDGTWVDARGYSRILDEYYAARGWDLERGWPTAETLRGLGLEDLVAEIEALRERPQPA